MVNGIKKTSHKKLWLQSGTSLIEMLIATLVVGVVVTAVAAGLTYSVKNQAEARSREVATNLSQSAMEIFARDRDTLGWMTFLNTLDETDYCMPNSISSIIDLPGACSAFLVDGLPGVSFVRTASISKPTINGEPGLRVELVTTWNRSGFEQRQVELIKVFARPR